jgi:hypothetical protein
MKQLGRPQPKSPDANREDGNVLNFFRSNGLQLMVQKNSVGFIIMIQLQIAILASDMRIQTRQRFNGVVKIGRPGFIHEVDQHENQTASGRQRPLFPD